VWFKQAHTANASIDGPHLKEEAVHVTVCLGIDGFLASDGWKDCFKTRHNLVYKTVLGESAIVNPETVMDRESEELPKIIGRYQPKNIFNLDETGLFCYLQPSRTLTYGGDFCHGGTTSKQRITVLLGCNAYDTQKLPLLVIGKYNKCHCFRNVKYLPTKHTVNSNSWMTSATFD
jgi:hypothetical protein